MKIYFLILNVYGMGGTVRTVLNTANYLATKNYDIEIISLFRRQRDPFFYINPKIKITVLHDVYTRENNRNDFRTKIANFLLKRKSRLIHKGEESINQFSLLTDLKLLFYIKSIKKGALVSTRPCFNLFVAKHASRKMTLVGQEHINFEAHTTGLKSAIKKYYSNLDYLITLTEKDNEHYKNIFGDEKLNVLKITNSVGDFSVKESPLVEKTVVAAGRLDFIKGYDMLIKAFSKVVEKNPDWKLKIFGSGKERDNLVKLIQETHLYNHVFLMGPTRNLESELLKSSVFAVSSRVEGFGLVIVEAMQNGVPVVSFDCPHGPSEIITDGKDGLLVDNEDISKLAVAINNLIENKNLRKKMGANAKKNIERFSIETIGEQWNRFFHHIKLGSEVEEDKFNEKGIQSNSNKLGA